MFWHTGEMSLSYNMLFFFNDTATTEIYTLSLHDALPIFRGAIPRRRRQSASSPDAVRPTAKVSPEGRTWASSRSFETSIDRKSTRLNSSHANISYAVFCLKKKHDTRLQQRAQLADHLECG